MKNKLFGFLLLGLIAMEMHAQPVRQTRLFTDNWKFHKGDLSNAEQETINDNDWRTVNLPHDWSIEGPFSQEWASGTGYLPGGIGWYRKSFTTDGISPGDKVFIYFDGVYKNSEVWLNGHSLGKRPNGYIPFQYELSPYLKKGNNTIAVKVDHSQFADSRWYPGSGIYRNVYLVIKKPVHIPLWGVSFNAAEVTANSAIARVQVSVNNALPANAAVKVECKLSMGSQVVATTSKTVTVAGNAMQSTLLSCQVAHPRVWSVDNPDLYTLTVSLYTNGKKTDEYSERVGFRNIRFDADKGFFLNDQNLKLKGVCIHQDAGALGSAVPREVWQRRLMKLKEAGCNAIRMSHYPHQDYLYELCDELGFLVMDEAFDEWEVGKNKWIAGWNAGTPGKDGYHEYFNEWAEKDVKDMILRNQNHPCIIMWSIGNEIDYPNDPYTHEVLSTGRNPQIYGKGYLPDHPPASRLGDISKRLVAVVKQTDTTRPVTAALAGVVMSNTTTYPENLDVVGYNYQEYRYVEDHNQYPQRKIYGSENNKNPATWMAVDTSKNIFGQFLWTGFDFMGEARAWPVRSSGAGLLDLAGFPKPEYFVWQTLWSQKPVVYLITSRNVDEQQERGWRAVRSFWIWQAGENMRITGFTNCDEVELFLNGESLGKKPAKDSTARGLNWQANYAPGELYAKGFVKGKEVARFILKTPGEVTTVTAITDKSVFHAGKKDLAHIEIQISDKNGTIMPFAANEVTVNINGPAVLLGMESGNLASHEDYQSNKRKVYNGRVLAYIQSTGKPGPVKITVSSPGLQTATISISSVK